MINFTNLKFLLTSLLILVQLKFVFSQDSLPVNYFRSPINSKLIVTSNFGEIRTNHFHTGLDIYTKGR
ncbi:MAG: hypothetical protein JXR51_12350, partial [Bacteroidales bacterium]|nr:hypothetical protein [Bacteroidales bacterium]